MIEISEAWKSRWPGAVVGVLVMRGASNPAPNAALEALREQVEAGLREQFAAGDRAALTADPVMAAYAVYYKAFRKTYHVLLQRESVIEKGRRIPSISALVQAMFMAELKNGLLTAGHDLARVAPPIRVDAAAGTESYTGMGGEERRLKEGDMMIRDADAVISSVIHGPDARTAIGPDTKDLLFTAYAPAGIGAERVRAHMEDIRRFVGAAAPAAVTVTLETYCAD
jgi:DNA/RNA-binding domain of Phe-tRNA-synthetase-like protein